MKNLLKTKRAEGFTIIEVMIVLAIAGLIMVIVFIAVPQLQRNQRDNARQNTANRTKAEIETYAGNNQGLYPFGTDGVANANGTLCASTVTGCWSNFVANYISGGKVKVADPSTGADVVGNTTLTGLPQGCADATCSAATKPAAKGDFVVVYGAACDGENLKQSGANSLKVRTYAVMMGMDRGNRYCVDNG
jgi:prepilin-type N-terminal cleavage/methylation domain-containing protein